MKKQLSTKGAPLSVYSKDPGYVVNDMSVRYEYKGDEKTDIVAGILYTVTGQKSYTQFDILVKESRPIITSEELEELKDNGENLIVTFSNAVVKPYYNERLKSIQDSIRADAIHRAPVK